MTGISVEAVVAYANVDDIKGRLDIPLLAGFIACGTNVGSWVRLATEKDDVFCRSDWIEVECTSLDL